MTVCIRVAETGNDLLTVNHSVKFLWDRLPLAWGLVKTDVSVCSNTFTVHDERYSALVTFRIEVIERHGIDALIIEITRIIETEILGTGDHNRRQQENGCKNVLHSNI